MIRIIATLALLFAGWAGTALAQDITKKGAAQDRSAQSYTEQVARGLAAKMPTSKVAVVGEFALSIRRANGSEVSLNVANLYHDYKNDPTTLGAIIDVYAQGLAAQKPQGAPAGLDRTRIVPVIKDRAWLVDGERALKARGVTARFLFDEFNEELVIVYALDEANRTRYLMANERIGVARNDLRKLAVQNLGDILPDVQIRQEEGGSFALLKAGGDYEASLLLFDGIWRNGPVKVDGDIVVAIPAKDVLLVTGSKNLKGVTALRLLAAKLKAESRYQLTDTLFVYRDGRFVRFTGK